MFPINDNDWISYIQSAAANNANPCWVDIVGDAQYRLHTTISLQRPIRIRPK
jgi:hypothetical protein